MVQGVILTHNGLAPSILIPYLRYDNYAYVGDTQCI